MRVESVVRHAGSRAGARVGTWVVATGLVSAAAAWANWRLASELPSSWVRGPAVIGTLVVLGVVTFTYGALRTAEGLGWVPALLSVQVGAWHRAGSIGYLMTGRGVRVDEGDTLRLSCRLEPKSRDRHGQQIGYKWRLTVNGKPNWLGDLWCDVSPADQDAFAAWCQKHSFAVAD